MLRSVTSDFRKCSSSTVTVQWRQSWKGLSRVFFIAAFVIGDPGAVSGGKGKSKQREKHGQRKVGELFAFSPTLLQSVGARESRNNGKISGKKSWTAPFLLSNFFFADVLPVVSTFLRPHWLPLGFRVWAALHDDYTTYYTPGFSSFSILFILVIIRLPERLYFFTSKILLFFCGTPCIQEG